MTAVSLCATDGGRIAMTEYQIRQLIRQQELEIERLRTEIRDCQGKIDKLESFNGCLASYRGLFEEQVSRGSSKLSTISAMAHSPRSVQSYVRSMRDSLTGGKYGSALGSLDNAKGKASRTIDSIRSDIAIKQRNIRSCEAEIEMLRQQLRVLALQQEQENRT